MRSKISTIYNGVDLEKFKPITLNGQYKENNPVKFLVLGTVKFLKNVVGLAKASVCLNNQYGIMPVIRWVGRILNIQKIILHILRQKEF